MPTFYQRFQESARKFPDNIALEIQRQQTVERDRHQGPNALWHDVKEDLNDLGAFLGDISDRAWLTKGLHPTRGVMTISQLIEELLIGHLEHHATQLEGLRAS